MRPRLALAAIVVWLMAIAAQTQENPGSVSEVRRHFVAKTVNGSVLYTATDITRMTPDHDLNVVALLTDRKTSLILTRDRDYREQDVIYEIRDPNRKAFVKVSFSFPFSARTREETIAESRSGKTRVGEQKLTMETPGLVISMGEGDWRNPDKAREWRSEIRESLDPVFLESLERLRGAFFVDPRTGRGTARQVAARRWNCSARSGPVASSSCLKKTWASVSFAARRRASQTSRSAGV